MEGKFQTSFIPKKPVGSQPNLTKPAHTTNLFSLIVTIIFVTVLLLTGLVFGYKMMVQQKNDKLNQELQQEIAKLDAQNETITALSRLDTRVESAKKLLNQHLALTSFFEFLSSSTLKTIQFKNFKYTFNADQKVGITMNGIAQSFTALTQQSDLLLDPETLKSVKNPAITNYLLDQEGRVVFTFSGELNPQAFLYKDTVVSSESADEVSMEVNLLPH
jgi:Tfp pilus assembly protein PilN